MARQLAPWLAKAPQLYRGERVPDPQQEVHPMWWNTGPPGERPRSSSFDVAFGLRAGRRGMGRGPTRDW